MNGDVGVWITMLTGATGERPDPEVSSLEQSCRALEDQIASLENDRVPELDDAQLQAAVSDLSKRQAELKEECALLEAKIRDVLERRRASALASHEAVSRQRLASDAIETIRRASEFFATDFFAMTPAQIDSRRPNIARQLAAMQQSIHQRITDACTVLEEHAPVRDRMKERESELTELGREIESLEQQLGTRHHVQPAVFDTLRRFTADQISSYHEDVIRARLNDARHEAARKLPNDIWRENG